MTERAWGLALLLVAIAAIIHEVGNGVAQVLNAKKNVTEISRWWH